MRTSFSFQLTNPFSHCLRYIRVQLHNLLAMIIQIVKYSRIFLSEALYDSADGEGLSKVHVDDLANPRDLTQDATRPLAAPLQSLLRYHLVHTRVVHGKNDWVSPSPAVREQSSDSDFKGA